MWKSGKPHSAWFSFFRDAAPPNMIHSANCGLNELSHEPQSVAEQ
jgi:hypothetical protein